MNANVAKLAVALFQKRRGQGGKYEEVLGGDSVRVDKNKGKILKALVYSPNFDLSNVELNVQIVMASDSDTVLVSEGVSVETVRFDDQKPCVQVEMMLKILRNAKSLQLYVTASQCGACVACGSSVWFQSHNNGKQKSSPRAPSPVTIMPQLIPATPEVSPCVTPVCSPVCTPVSSPVSSPVCSPFLDNFELPEAICCSMDDELLFESMLIDEVLNNNTHTESRKRSLEETQEENCPFFMPTQILAEPLIDWDFTDNLSDEPLAKRSKICLLDSFLS